MKEYLVSYCLCIKSIVRNLDPQRQFTDEMINYISHIFSEIMLAQNKKECLSLLRQRQKENEGSIYMPIAITCLDEDEN